MYDAEDGEIQTSRKLINKSNIKEQIGPDFIFIDEKEFDSIKPK